MKKNELKKDDELKIKEELFKFWQFCKKNNLQIRGIKETLFNKEYIDLDLN